MCIRDSYRVVNNFMHFLTKPIIKNADVKCACSNVAAKWMFGTVSNVNIIHNGVEMCIRDRYHSILWIGISFAFPWGAVSIGRTGDCADLSAFSINLYAQQFFYK